VTWETDESPASLYTRAYVLGMRLARDKHAFEGEEHTRQVALQRQEHGDAPPTRWTRLTTRVRTERAAGMTVWRIRPRRGRVDVRVFYVHGGGYVHPLTKDYWRLTRSLTRAPAEVVVPAYPLAPDARVDDVLPRLLETESSARAEDPDVPTLLMGDSAGGALVVVMAMQLRDQGRPAPAGVVALSPWLDAELKDDEVKDLEATDPMLAESGLRAAGRWWAGDRGPGDPLVSPVNADLRGLPPVDVFIGDRDILRPGVETFARAAERDGIRLRVHETVAMFHVWMTRAIPEGRRTRNQLRRLVIDRSAARRPSADS
jgi:monoterpene epsilon-lactone hydrolase